jgi:HEPN domain-containing protein
MFGELVHDWVDHAEQDWNALNTLLSGDLERSTNPAATNAQQCAEKYLKALIVAEGEDPPRTHQLQSLLELLLPAYPQLAVLATACARLEGYAVATRYPGSWTSVQDAEEAARMSGQVRIAVRDILFPGEGGQLQLSF